MAKWTLTQYLFEVRRRLDEYDTDLFSDDELKNYINEALNEMTDGLELQSYRSYTPTAPTSTVDGRELFISSEEETKPIEERTMNLYQIRLVKVGNEKKERITFEQSLEGKEGFYMWGDDIHFTNPVSSKIEVFYLRLPKRLEEEMDVGEIKEKYQHIVLEYACAKAKQKDENYANYDYDLNRFYDMTNQMQSELQKRENSTTTSPIVTISHYMDGGDLW